MTKNLRWRIPLVVIVIAIGIMALYPPAEKVLKRERIKEIDGKVVERIPLEGSWTRLFVTNPVTREKIISEETDKDGKKVQIKEVEYFAKGKVKLGLDLKGGSELLYRVRVDESEDHPSITKEVIEVLKKRIDPKGVIEYRIQEYGNHRVLIQVPGATRTEIESLKDRITRLGKLEFRLAASPESPEYKEALQGKQVPGYYKHWIGKRKGEEGKDGQWYLVRNKTEISGEHLSRVYVDRKGIEPVIGFEFDTIGKSKFGQLTERNIGKPLAIILDGILYSAPVIRDRIPGKGIIEGNFTQKEVNDLVAVLRAGSLPADLELEMETTVGPSLGRDSIKKGLYAGVVGSIFVVIFIGVYYLGVGWVANCANFLNIFLIMGAMALLDATLTLPGIAGLVLLIGMGIDSNVLIFERIREEKAKGKSLRSAIKAGYERAFSAIFDSNITTLITGVILAAVGTGPVKGFAWILILGLIINLFTAIFVTRTIYELFMDLGWIKKFSMLRLIGVPGVKFVNYRLAFAALSVVCVITGMVIFAVRGNKKYDIDFTGGTLVHLHLNNPVQPDLVRTALAESGYREAEVQSIWTREHMPQTTSDANEFGIRIKELNKEKVQEKISEDVNTALKKAGVVGTIEFVDTLTFHLSLQKPTEEKVVYDILNNAGYTDEDVISVVSASDRSANIFTVSMKPLRAGKVQEKIKKDLIEKFHDNLYTEQISISFELLSDKSKSAQLTVEGVKLAGHPSNPEEVKHKGAGSGVAQFRMTFSKPLKKELIEEVLTAAGYPDILENGLEEGKEYQTVTIALDPRNAKEVTQTLKAFEIPTPLKRMVSIGSTVAGEMKNRAILAVIFSFIATIFYVWFRFGDFKFGAAAIMAVIHDILITLGAVAAADYLFGNMKIDSAMVAAFLTVVGYSLNDTIVIFDRVRENMGGKVLTTQVVNESINQTLSRTILTGVTTIGVLCALFFLGGTEIHGFAFVMMVGVIVGTYSTIFIACPALLGWRALPAVSKASPRR